MSFMFSGNKKIQELDLSSFSSKSLKYIPTSMFEYMGKLTTIYVANNFDLSNVDTPNPELNYSGDKYAIFTGCSKLKGGNGTKWTSSLVSVTYGRIDKQGQPGYFTLKQ